MHTARTPPIQPHLPTHQPAHLLLVPLAELRTDLLAVVLDLIPHCSSSSLQATVEEEPAREGVGACWCIALPPRGCELCSPAASQRLQHHQSASKSLSKLARPQTPPDQPLSQPPPPTAARTKNQPGPQRSSVHAPGPALLPQHPAALPLPPPWHRHPGQQPPVGRTASA